eukprot:1266964-Prymnesium_polylepis.2
MVRLAKPRQVHVHQPLGSGTARLDQNVRLAGAVRGYGGGRATPHRRERHGRAHARSQPAEPGG